MRNAAKSVATRSALALQHPDLLRIGSHAFIMGEDYWNRINQALPEIGFRIEPTKTPVGAEALYVSPDSEKMRRAKCGPCGHLNSTLGCRAEGGFWCVECGTLLHLGCSAEPGQESVFELSFTGETENGWTPSYEVRLRLLDYDPQTRTILVDSEPLGSRYARGEDEGPDPKIAQQRGYLERFTARLHPEMATHRMTIGDDIGHSRLAHPISAYRFAWPVHNRPDGEEHPNGEGLHIRCETRTAVHRHTEVLIAGPDQKVVAETGIFGTGPDASLTIIPAFRVYPPVSGPGLLNQVFDHIGRPGQTLLPDYVSRTGGWDPTVLSKGALQDARRFAEAFTAIDLEGWDRVVAQYAHGHHARLFLELARHCSAEHLIRTRWLGGSYHEMSLEEAAAYLDQAVPAKRRPRHDSEDGAYLHIGGPRGHWCGGPRTHRPRPSTGFSLPCPGARAS